MNKSKQGLKEAGRRLLSFVLCFTLLTAQFPPDVFVREAWANENSTSEFGAVGESDAQEVEGENSDNSVDSEETEGGESEDTQPEKPEEPGTDEDSGSEDGESPAEPENPVEIPGGEGEVTPELPQEPIAAPDDSKSEKEKKTSGYEFRQTIDNWEFFITADEGILPENALFRIQKAGAEREADACAILENILSENTTDSRPSAYEIIFVNESEGEETAEPNLENSEIRVLVRSLESRAQNDFTVFGVDLREKSAAELALGCDGEASFEFSQGLLYSFVPVSDSPKAAFKAVKVLDGAEIIVTAGEGVFPEQTEMEAEKITDFSRAVLIGAIVSEAVPDGKKIEKILSFDISFWVNSEGEASEVQPNLEAGELTVTIRDTSESEEKETAVFHVDLEEKLALEAESENTEDSVSFSTQHLSVYSLVLFSEVTKLEGEGTAENPYVINNAAELVFMRDKINAVDAVYAAPGVRFKLTEDIDLSGICYPANEESDTSEVSWTPIGLALSSRFRGVFDGNGKTISGLYINASVANQGLFGYVNGGSTSNLAKITDLTVEGKVNGATAAGGISGFASNTIFENCVNRVDVTGKSNVGGIVGQGAANASFSGCINEGEISGTLNAGGIVGTAAGVGTVSGCSNAGKISCSGDSAGGIVGNKTTGSIADCTNTAAVKSTGKNVGGIAGNSGGCAISGSVNESTVTGGTNVGGISGTATGGNITVCINKGEVKATGSASTDYSGGIVGTKTSAGNIENCANFASVSSAGGLYGSIAGNINANANILRCFSSVENLSLCGTQTGKVTDSYYLTSDGKEIAGCPGEAVDADSVAAGEVVWLLNGGPEHKTIWAPDENGYPALGDSDTKPVYRVRIMKSSPDSEAEVFFAPQTGVTVLQTRESELWADSIFVTLKSETPFVVPLTVKVAADGELPFLSSVPEGSVEEAEEQTVIKVSDSDVDVTYGLRADDDKPDVSWYNPSATSFVLSNTDQLRGFASLVNGGNDFAGKTVTLQSGEWDLTDVELRPIGTKAYPFAGTFDGGYNFLHGLHIESDHEYIGFFGCVSQTSIIRNLAVEGKLTGTGTAQYAGGIVGYSQGGRVLNCAVDVQFGDAVAVSGGIVGHADSATTAIENSIYIGPKSPVGSGTATVQNSYYLAETPIANAQGEHKGADAFKYGEVAWLLDGGNETRTQNWTQGEEYPLPAKNEPVFLLKFTAQSSLLAGCTINMEESANESYKVFSDTSAKSEWTYLKMGSVLKLGIVTNSTENICVFMPSAGIAVSEGTATVVANQNYDVEYKFYGNSQADYSWYVGHSSPYTIKSAGQLLGFSNLVNGKDLPSELSGADNFKDKTVKLGTDIQMDFDCWTPIGLSMQSCFEGEFLGDGRTIFGLNIVSAEAAPTGLFGYLGESGTVKNLKLEDVYISHKTAGTPESGAVAGVNAGTITGCTVLGTVESAYAAGGISGNNTNSGRITDCVFEGNITASGGNDTYAGGIAGINTGITDNCESAGWVNADAFATANIGGIAGTNGGIIKNSRNTAFAGEGIPQAYLIKYVGGIVGKNTSSGKVDVCVNTADIAARLGSSSFAGGIAGDNEGTVANSYNTGNIQAKSENNHGLGGISGGNYNGSILNSYNLGNLSSEVANKKLSIWVGGIIGQNSGSEATISNCYSSGAISAVSDNPNVGGIVGITDNNLPENNYWSLFANQILNGIELSDSQKSAAGGGKTVGGGSFADDFMIDGQPLKNLLNLWVSQHGTKEFWGWKDGRDGLPVFDPDFIPELFTVVFYNPQNERYADDTLQKPQSVVGGERAVKPEPPLRPLGLPAHFECYWLDKSGEADKLWEFSMPIINNLNLYEVWLDPATVRPTAEWREAVTSQPEGYTQDDSARVVEVSSAEGLAWLANVVNGYHVPQSDSLANYTVKLTANVDVSGYVWTPISTSGGSRFSGTFDGGGNTITGLYINKEASGRYKSVGLFGASNGTIANVKLAKADITSEEILGQDGVGGIAGKTAGTVRNCTFAGVIKGVSQVGGITGYISGNGRIEACVNSGKISGKIAVGGIVGAVNTGATTEVVVDLCENYGDISSTEKEVGGIGGNLPNTDVRNCFNAGSIAGKDYVGGLSGVAATLQNSYNLGSVSGEDYVGGLGGLCDTVQNSYNLGIVSGSGNRVVLLALYKVRFENSYSSREGQSIEKLTDDLSSAQGCGYFDDGYVLTPADGHTLITAQDGYLLNALNAWKSKNPYNMQPWKTGGAGYPVFGLEEGQERIVITFHANDRSNRQATQSEIKGEDIILAQNMFERDGYSFKGWSTQPAGSDISYSDKATISHIEGDLDLYAVWETLWQGEGTAEKPFEIPDASALIKLAERVNEDNKTFAGVYFKITEDVVLSGEWTPIGTGSGRAFAGTFDGGGHRITGLSITNYSPHVGLFGYLRGASIKNLVLEGEINIANGTSGAAGTLAGTAESTVFGNIEVVANVSVSSLQNVGGTVGATAGSCTFTGVRATGGVAGKSAAGGILGEGTGTFTNCTFGNQNSTSSVSGGSSVGGIAGGLKSGGLLFENCENYAVIEAGGQNAGGIAGYGGIVNNCRNFGSILGDGGYVGGIVGRGSGSSVSDCGNSGTIVSRNSYAGGIAGTGIKDINTCTNSGAVSGTSHTGGLMGRFDITSSSSKNCNTGDVSGTENVGGLFGLLKSGSPLDMVVVSDFYNTGKVSGTGENIGGLVGSVSGSNLTVKNGYFYCEQNTDVGAIGKIVTSLSVVQNIYYYAPSPVANAFGVQKSEAAFAGGELSYLLDGGAGIHGGVWTQGQEFPVFGSPTYYKAEGSGVTLSGSANTYGPSGTTVTVSVNTAPAGYKFSGISLQFKDNTSVSIEDGGSFTMKDCDVLVKARFDKIGGGGAGEGEGAGPGPGQGGGTGGAGGGYDSGSGDGVLSVPNGRARNDKESDPSQITESPEMEVEETPTERTTISKTKPEQDSDTEPDPEEAETPDPEDSSVLLSMSDFITQNPLLTAVAVAVAAAIVLQAVVHGRKKRKGKEK